MKGVKSNLNVEIEPLSSDPLKLVQRKCSTDKKSTNGLYPSKSRYTPALWMYLAPSLNHVDKKFTLELLLTRHILPRKLVNN